ncbi:unnamed protein product [Closterium sp. NIES-54]
MAAARISRRTCTQSRQANDLVDRSLFNLIVAATIVGVAINAFPLMGDSLIRHSVALLRAKDPFLRRSGAYRLAFIASNDETRMKIVEAGALPHLLLLLESPFHQTEATPHSSDPPLTNPPPLAPPPLGPPPLSPSERRTVKEALTCLTHLAQSGELLVSISTCAASSTSSPSSFACKKAHGQGSTHLPHPPDSFR